MTNAEVTRVTPSTVTVRVGSRIVEVSGDAIDPTDEQYRTL